MKTKEIKRYNLPNERMIIKKIDAKPYELFIVFFLISILLVVNTTWYYGGGLALMIVIVFLIMPNRILIEFTNEFLVLYNKGNSSDCYIVYYEDVVSWKYNVGFKDDNLAISLIDGTTLKIEAFSKIQFEHYMNRFLKDKKEKK